MRIALVAGLVLRHGQRQLELTREVEGGKYILEDVVTRLPQVIEGHVLLKKIWDGAYEVAVERRPTESELTEAVEAISLVNLPEKAADEVAHRLRYIKAIKAAHLRRGQRDQIIQLAKTKARELGESPPSFSSLHRWLRGFDAHGPKGLVSGNVGRRRRRRLTEEQLSLVRSALRAIYFTRARHSLALAHADVIKRNDQFKAAGTIPQSAPAISIATLQREVRKVDMFHRIASREGRERAIRACRTAMNVDHPVGPLQRVEVDHTPLDWVVLCDRTGLPLGRPILTVAIDAFSGYPLGIYVSFHGASVTSVSGVIRSAVSMKLDQLAGFSSIKKPWIASGLFDLLVLDNGLEFHSKAFRRIAWTLETDLMYCKVRTPWLKPHVERFFASLNWLSLAKGRVRKSGSRARDELNPMKDAAIGFTAFVEGLLMFIVDVYPFQVNDRTLSMPFETYQEGVSLLPPVQYPGSMQEFKLASALSTERSVNAGGVQLFGMPYGADELLPLKRSLGNNFRTLVKWDPDDLSRLYLESPTDKSWLELPCRWTEYSKDLSQTQHQAIRAHRRKQLKSKATERDLIDSKLGLLDHWSYHASKMTRRDAKALACASGFTSARLPAPTQGDGATQDPTPNTPTVLLEGPSQDAADIPEFETFLL
ncbi:DDE-type integrase/transposase/recombinase [Mitsuaria sp. TWR114]|uniref:DDE-type integrase/transposase/recombinase n=1 Tax=Mitsuaria sp. TWR114 TaxID=2601731 RepID=UPI00164C2C01|nr:DDE-type integrase/transposase/recombinase [Mitsuaria sp. TWR114]